ncbi:hypothetical protein T440DRAFT_409339 [Plenodomus tracheiphilus IPT5]|uniref:Zn(2)-C6 fungal-type domain-containing protein n=1 Tax=Plenodomus tracheiphilus IPT5 TaxID=1408161 RepID=A0A6A7AQ20_9PLEO|nr:hypothetical protein T440DRAFT_409339 [Plenodomus tracheiphilus IPT5]
MRLTLRRSCDACAKSKLSCDLRTPQCSRCTKKNTLCVYANQPLTSSPPNARAFDRPETSPEVSSLWSPLKQSSAVLLNTIDASVDPFNSYPRTNLARVHEQRLIQHFLSKIAFQYYPLDLDASSNPFVVMWWPLALSDPALFHVSLQTASLDIDLRDRRGFANSEILMADSVSLVRKRVEDPSLVLQDATMDSVVTLAAIEFGKGQTEIGQMHIDGIINMVHLRGGIHQVKVTSPLTARMVSWVSLILTQRPQFATQDDCGIGAGIAPILQWIQAAKPSTGLPITPLDGLDLDLATSETLRRLRKVLHDSNSSGLSTTDLHDLTCFVLHRMLGQLSVNDSDNAREILLTSECVRKAASLYMLNIHGPTYFSHAGLQQTLVQDLRACLDTLLLPLLVSHSSVALWLLSVGMVSSEDEHELQWFNQQAKEAIRTLNISSWQTILAQMRMVLWFNSRQMERLSRDRWKTILGGNA